MREPFGAYPLRGNIAKTLDRKFFLCMPLRELEPVDYTEPMTSSQNQSRSFVAPAWWVDGQRAEARRVMAEFGPEVARITRDSWQRTAAASGADNAGVMAHAAADVWAEVVR